MGRGCSWCRAPYIVCVRACDCREGHEAGAIRRDRMHMWFVKVVRMCSLQGGVAALRGVVCNGMRA